MGKIVLNKEKTTYTVKYVTALILFALLRSIGTYIFINPNGFAPGGVPGIASLVHYMVVKSSNPTVQKLASSLFDPGVITIIINIPLMIVAFKFLNKRFAFYTMIGVLVYSAFMILLGAVKCPQYDAENQDGLMLIAALAGGAISGVSGGLMFRINMSSGGTDIIGKLMHKHNPSAHVQYWILLCDCVIACFSGLVGIVNLDTTLGPTAIMTSILSPILYSFLSLIVHSRVSDIIESGMLSSLVFTIITDQAEAIAHELSIKLHRGVTITKSIGYYTGKEHKMIVCVTSKRQINSVKQIVSSCDPHAFMYITQAGEVSGKGFDPDLIKEHKEKIEYSDHIPSEMLSREATNAQDNTVFGDVQDNN